MIYLTSFNEQLFDATGEQMLESFALHQPNDEMIIYTEGNLLSKLAKYPNLRHVESIDDNKILNKWLEDNADIIPVEFGGNHTCDCNYDKSNPSLGHVDACPSGSMRRRASHWFRKAMSWKLASDRDINEVVWIDCDSRFIKNIPESLIREYMRECHTRFHYGDFRRSKDVGIETGIVMFDLVNGADTAIKWLWARFMDGTFRMQKRWDDAWMLTVTARKLKFIVDGDLHPRCRTNEPMDDGPLSQHLRHDKGIHWKNYGVHK